VPHARGFAALEGIHYLVGAVTLDKILTATILREGGYVDHPADKGGPTNMGITIATLSAWRGHPATATDISTLTEGEARSIYTKRYWQDPGLDKVPGEELQSVLFDCAVNHGAPRAIRMLQAALGIKEDGIMGPVTLAALPHLDTRKVALKVLAHRVRFFGSIISHNHSQAVFASGWLNRAAELIEELA